MLSPLHPPPTTIGSKTHLGQTQGHGLRELCNTPLAQPCFCPLSLLCVYIRVILPSIHVLFLFLYLSSSVLFRSSFIWVLAWKNMLNIESFSILCKSIIKVVVLSCVSLILCGLLYRFMIHIYGLWLDSWYMVGSTRDIIIF